MSYKLQTAQNLIQEISDMVVAQWLSGVNDSAQIRVRMVSDDVYAFVGCAGRIHVFDARYVFMSAKVPEQLEMPDQPFRSNITFLTKLNIMILSIDISHMKNGHLATFEQVQAAGVGAVQRFLLPSFTKLVPWRQVARLPCFVGISTACACGRFQIHQKHEQIQRHKREITIVAAFQRGQPRQPGRLLYLGHYAVF